MHSRRQVGAVGTNSLTRTPFLQYIGMHGHTYFFTVVHTDKQTSACVKKSFHEPHSSPVSS